MAKDDVDYDRIRRIIEGCLALAGNNPNQEEAQAALEKAHELMKRYTIDLSELHRERGTSWEIDEWGSEEKTQFDTWQQYLAMAIAKLFNCKMWIHSSSWAPAGYWRKRIFFAGEKHDLMMCADVWPWICNHAKKMANQEFGTRWNYQHRTFCEAFGTRIIARVNAMTKKSEQTDAGASTQYGLVVSDKVQKTTMWLAERGYRFKAGKVGGRGGRNDYDAASKGRAAADQVNLNFKSGIGASNPKKIKG